jgi:hypothetical protein
MARSRGYVFALGVPLAVLGLFACSNIVGLDDYDKVVCTGLVCDAGTTTRRDAQTADGPSLLDASGSSPVQWPRFKMPNYPQDGGPTENRASYAGDAGAVVDNVSKLVWREPVEAGVSTFQEARAKCAAITTGGRWRLPSRIELITLIDLRGAPTIDRTFASTESIPYWTSSEARPYPLGAERRRWIVNFANGAPDIRNENERAGVRCIKDL